MSGQSGGSAAGCLVWRLRTPPREGTQGTQLLRPYAAIRRAFSGLASLRLFGRLGRDDPRSFNANRPYAAPAALLATRRRKAYAELQLPRNTGRACSRTT